MIGKFLYHVSFEACDAPLVRMPGRLGSEGSPAQIVDPSSTGGHMWILAVVMLIGGGAFFAAFWYRKQRAALGADSTQSTPASAIATPARHQPPPPVYGPLTGKVRVEWPESKLHGKMMWASSFNKDQNTYVCKTHEPGAAGVRPHYIAADKLVAEVE
jgi:hypothetical protein